ncbi:MAG: glycosyltransferase [Bacteroidales bacterium]
MKIFIIHYHLYPGGVTKIVDYQIKSIKLIHPERELEIICGFSDFRSVYEDFNVPVTVVPELDYMQKESYSKDEIDSLVSKLYEFFKENVAKDDIIHFHNLNLGKNPAATYCMYKLATEEYNILNHAHDFAEDRPVNMAFNNMVIAEKLSYNPKEIMYPLTIDNYRFGVINTSDQKRLLDVQVPAHRIDYLPNPVNPPALSDLPGKEECKELIQKLLQLSPEKKIVTYPVRVIRRKNIGELILLSEIFKDEATFLVTLPPENPVEKKFYDQWLQFCEKNNFHNVLFEVNSLVDFDILLHGSDFCITTSYREGFGMVFMEPWLYCTPVTGRDIEYITRDFVAQELQFPNLYEEIYIEEQREDFKNLTIEEQMDVILSLSGDSSNRHKLLYNNPRLKDLLNEPDNRVVKKNKSVIINNYSFESYGSKLVETYKKFFR